MDFLICRCGANIDKRIHNRYTSIRDTELRNDFMLAMQAYVPEADIRVEFPSADTSWGLWGCGAAICCRLGRFC